MHSKRTIFLLAVALFLLLVAIVLLLDVVAPPAAQPERQEIEREEPDGLDAVHAMPPVVWATAGWGVAVHP